MINKNSCNTGPTLQEEFQTISWSKKSHDVGQPGISETWEHPEGSVRGDGRAWLTGQHVMAEGVFLMSVNV